MSKKNNFWAGGDNVYVSLYNDFSGDLKTKDEIRFYLSLFTRGRKLIEFGCGTGRVMLPLLKAGYKIDGLDLSASMLKILKNSLKAEGLKGAVYRRDLCKFKLSGKYDGAILSQRTFNFISDADDQLKALVNISSVMKRGAKLVINLMPARPDKFASVQKTKVKTGHFVNSKTGKKVQFWSSWIPDPMKQLWHMEDEFREGNKRCSVKMKMRSIFPSELKLMLLLGGFKLMAVYGSWKKRPFVRNSKDLIVVARKV